MKITKDEVLHVAKLARLNMDLEAVDTYARQIADILEYVDILDQVDTEGIGPTSHAIFLSNAFREDRVHDHLENERVLENAPQAEDGFFIVPKIIGG